MKPGAEAAQVAKLYPNVKQDYHRWMEHSPVRCQLGFWQAVNTPDKRTIINLITQQKYGPVEEGPYVSYPAIKKGLTSIMVAYPDKILALPKIGAGLAGGNWTIIEKIINDVVKDRTIHVYYL